MGYSECSQAEVLRKGLKSLRASQDFAQRVVLPGVIGLSGVISALGGFVRPQGPGQSDHNVKEKIANVLSSIPFVLVGCHTMRKRKTGRGKLYGASLIGVGGASMAFHSSSGGFRNIARKIDYWSIAISTACMNSAVFPNVHPIFWIAQLAVIPFRPFCLSSANTSIMEVEYLRRAHKNPDLRTKQRLHSATCALGLGCWCCEDSNPKTPFLHSIWHLVACLSCGTTNGLLEDVERTNGLAGTVSAAC